MDKSNDFKQKLDGYQVSVLIPAYNEAEAIGDVIDMLKSVLPVHFELLVVNDASKDDTSAIAKNHGAKVIDHKVNMGYGAALKTGLKNAKNEIVVFFDADGQHDVKYFLTLLEALDDADMAVGARQNIAIETWWRLPGKWVIHKLANYLSQMKIPDLNCGFRAAHKSVLLRYEHLLCDRFSFSTTSTMVLLGEGKLIKYVPIQVHSRIGTSTVTIKSGFETILLVIRMVVQFNPLRVFLPMVFTTAIVGFIFLIYDLIHFDVSNTTIVLFLTTLMLFGFGIVTDQIASLRKELNRKPTYE